MVQDVLLAVVAVLVPAVALTLEHLGNVHISERHHSHHDTYAVPAPFTRAIALAMAFMGAMGLLMGWLCRENVFEASHVTVLAFFDAFLVTSLVAWAALRRYRVSVFGDSLVVRPFFGREVWVRYSEIERLEWSGIRMESGFRSLDVWIGGRRVVRIDGIVDVEQIIMSIDRFDLLPRTL